MRTGRLSISRGHEILSRLEAGPAAAAPVAPVGFHPAPAVTEMERVHVRLAAIERLARLVEQGILSHEEFREEKALVMNLTGEELLLSEIAPPEHLSQGPSLVGRILNWRVALVALAAGVGLSWGIQPDETAALLEQSLAALGG